MGMYILCILYYNNNKHDDSVNHNIFLPKLDKYSIRDLTYNLIKSFLTNRYQQFHLNQQRSRHVMFMWGVKHKS